MELERERDDFDFDFVDRKSLKAQLLRRRWCVAWLCSGAFAVVLFVLAIVALAKPEDNCSTCVSVSTGPVVGAEGTLAYHCLYALGGGRVNRDSLAFPQLKRPECGSTFDKYFGDGGQYWKDLDIALNDATLYFNNKTTFPEVDSSMVVVFDIDETSLSNLEAIRDADWDRAFNHTANAEWMQRAVAPAINQTLKLYKSLWSKGFGVTFITGRDEILRNATVLNLQRAGYGFRCSELEMENPCYLELGMRNGSADAGKNATVYKSEKREKFLDDHNGTTFVGCLGDQFSDLLGENGALALFKVPNPVYFIA